MKISDLLLLGAAFLAGAAIENASHKEEEKYKEFYNHNNDSDCVLRP